MKTAADFYQRPLRYHDERLGLLRSLSNEFHPSGEIMKTLDKNVPVRLQYFDKRWQYAAAVLSMLAGWIHVFFAPEHFEEWVGYGVSLLWLPSVSCCSPS